MTSTAESRNGIRQPQARNDSSLWKTARKASRPLAISWPAGAPACGHEAQKPRCFGWPCSETMRTAPPHSPPSAKPWTQRSTVSSTGASTPTWAWLGSSPIANVATPIISSETMSSFLRPSLSPKCPKTRPPSGRKTKPIQYVANDRSVACSGSVALGKNTCGKTAAAATPYRKKSYHSTVVPTRLAPTMRAMGDLRRVVSGARALVWDMSVLLGTGWDALPVCRWAGWCGAIRRGDAGGGRGVVRLSSRSSRRPSRRTSR